MEGSQGTVGEQSATRLNSILATPRQNEKGAAIRTQQRTAESGQTLSGNIEGSALGAGLPSLRTLLLHRGLATVYEQAVALSLALAAYSAVSQSRTTARLAWRGQFFIHLVKLFLVDLRQATHTRLPLFLHEISCQKGFSRPMRRESAGLSSTGAVAGQIKQLTVSSRYLSGCTGVSMRGQVRLRLFEGVCRTGLSPHGLVFVWTTATVEQAHQPQGSSANPD